MGTVVLSPQDCLSSPLDRRNSYLSSARSEIGRKRFQAVMIPSHAAQDCARHSHSGGSPPGDGLLPIPPLIHGQTRVLSKRSPSKVSSSSTLPNPLPTMFQESFSPRMMPKLPRSASAILPTPSVVTPPLAEGLLKGRLPFKVVQGNGPGNSNDHVQGNVPKKIHNQRHGVRKKIAITSNNISNNKAGSNHEKLKFTSKQPQDGAVSRGQSSNLRKETNARIRRILERSSSGEGPREMVEMKTEAPVVTILQRPKTDEAAVELFVKFFQNGTQQCFGSLNEEMEAMSQKSEKSYAMVNDSESENHYAPEEASESELSDVDPCKNVSTPSSKSLAELKRVAKALKVDVSSVTAPFKVREHFDSDNLHGSKAPVLEAGCEELAQWERWAGPSYINSPPPSALPLPRFSKKHLKVETMENAHEEQMEETICDHFSTPSSSISPLYTSLKRQRYLNINSEAVATATKDLKRILNLDLCRM
ncbi:hypothetical protein GOP47_0010968 [Adiantum capillus-veneris]|uniref:Uncharacterized protein n=1 Tax=Adiantum capillus-veneris TaxID=13818 RepID=A0A9D4ZIC1_ADICA|nr:hypothetical protein GOP47_0010968 [Adiantum capillus-veneris]